MANLWPEIEKLSAKLGLRAETRRNRVRLIALHREDCIWRFSSELAALDCLQRTKSRWIRQGVLKRDC